MIPDINFKKSIPLIIILLIVFCFRLDAWKVLELGLKGGVNFSSYIGEGSYTTYWEAGSRDNFIKPGLIAGLYYIRSLKKNCFLQIELLYTQKGANTSFKSISYGSGEYYKMTNSWKGNQNLTYFELPVLMKFLNIPRLPFKSMSYVGVSPSILYNAKAKYNFKFVAEDESGNITDEYSEKDVSYEIYHSIKPFNFELIAGMSIHIKRIWFDLRYSLSLVPIDQRGQVRNHSFSATIGVPFH
ncbi:MAG: porin family protein [Candidatus Celaenobacter polaris]|nr:porin family protein [Candidatus Celaenobacter polaris]